MSSIKDKIAELEQDEVQPLKENGSCLPTSKYCKDKDWDKVRLNIIGMLNAFKPEVIDNTDRVKNQCIQIVEDELAAGRSLYAEYKEDELKYGMIETEGYIRACTTILNQIKEWV